MNDFVVVANRLPVDRVERPDGAVRWKPSPGGLVAALEPVMRAGDGAWVGWSGSPARRRTPSRPTAWTWCPWVSSEQEIADYYAGFSNATLWPLYHDVIAPPVFHRQWWDTYQTSTAASPRPRPSTPPGARRSGCTTTSCSSCRALLREARPDLRIGFFNHIPFPGYEIFAQLPWRSEIVEGLLGADLRRLPAPADANNFLRACRRAAGLQHRGLQRRGRARRRAARPGRALPDLAWTRPASRSSPGADDVRARAKRDPGRSRRPPSSCCSASTGSTTPRGSCTG